MSKSPTTSNDQIREKECPKCSSSNLDEDFEDVCAICKECGFVIRDFDTDSSAGDEPDQSAETEGRDDSPAWSEAYTVTNSTEQQTAEAFAILEEIARPLNLSEQVRRKAATLFSSAAKQNATDGRPTETTVAAAVHVASRAVKEPRPLSRIAEAVERDHFRVGQLARDLRQQLDHEYTGVEPAAYLPFLGGELNYTPEIIAQAEQLLTEAGTAKMANGRSPVGIAGAALYLASDGEHPQREVASIAGVSKETIRVRVKDLRDLSEMQADEEGQR